MKKFFLVASFILVAIAINAQATFGIKAGANFSNIKVSGDGESRTTDMKVGLNIGGLANIPFSSMFSVQPELVFSMEGGKEESDGDKESLNLNYINVPVLLQYNSSGFLAETGPQIGFLMGAKLKSEYNGDEEEVDVKDDLENINLSWAIGLGYKLPSSFGFNARYNLGLSNIVKDEDDLGRAKQKASTIQVGVFYTFGGGGSMRK